MDAFEGTRRVFRKPPEIIPDDAPLREEELFDENGDIPDDDEVIIGANGVEDDDDDEDDEDDSQSWLQGLLTKISTRRK